MTLDEVSNGKWFSENKHLFFKKYTDEELIKDIHQFLYESGRLNVFFSHFFDECLYKCCGYNKRPLNKEHPESSPYEALNSDTFIENAFAIIERNPKFFNGDAISNLKSFFRNKRPRKVANFPVREAQRLVFSLFPEYDMFEPPLNIHDACCGFGSRMSSALLSGCNYYGTDVNEELIQCLETSSSFLRKNHFTRGKTDIRLQGSEERIEEWVGKMDISFTSPPYFNLEYYSNDSYKSSQNYHNYDLWKKEFVRPTCENIHSYLKNGGYALINIKNLSSKQPLFDDFVEEFLKLGMKRLSDEQIHISSKTWNKEETFNENVMRFQKIS